MLTGTDAAILAFIDADRCLVVDWRGVEEEITWGVQQWLPTDALSFQIAPEDSTGDITITARFRNREDTFTLPPRPQNDFRVLLRVGQLLQPEYAIELFRCTEGDDTHGFLLRSATWWKSFQEEYLERYSTLFSDLETLTKLWELDRVPESPSASEAKVPQKPWWRLW